MPFDLFLAIGAARTRAALEAPDCFLARIDLDPDDRLLFARSPAYDVVVRQDRIPIARVRCRGTDELAEWGVPDTGDETDMHAFRACLEEQARAYLGIRHGAADALVAALVACDGNGASAALCWRQVLGEARQASDPKSPAHLELL